MKKYKEIVWCETDSIHDMHATYSNVYHTNQKTCNGNRKRKQRIRAHVYTIDSRTFKIHEAWLQGGHSDRRNSFDVITDLITLRPFFIRTQWAELR